MALVKTSKVITNNILYCDLYTPNGVYRVVRYYDCPYDLIRALRQLLNFRCKLWPVFAVIEGRRLNNIYSVLC